MSVQKQSGPFEPITYDCKFYMKNVINLVINHYYIFAKQYYFVFFDENTYINIGYPYLGQIYNDTCGARLDELVAALTFVEDYLVSISSGAMRDIFNVGAAVIEIETNSASARTKATNTLQVSPAI